MTPNRYAHVADWEYRNSLESVIRCAQAALSETAIDDYAAEKIETAAQRLECARKRFTELHPGTDWLGRWVRGAV
ncbi:MAG TPA: hypothetical protein VG348_15820 [Acidimicrobiia bacterium]|jgi:hypothetical protein|nr:hypothetical protein [Acidimicrobiia bacterium]